MIVCKGITLKGKQCKRIVKNGEYCCSHISQCKLENEKVEEQSSLEDAYAETKLYCLNTIKGIHSYVKTKIPVMKSVTNVFKKITEVKYKTE